MPVCRHAAALIVLTLVIHCGRPGAARSEPITPVSELLQEFPPMPALSIPATIPLASPPVSATPKDFIPLTRLEGEVLVTVTGTDQGQLSVGQRMRLNLDTSYSGKDRLRVRLQAANIANLATVTNTDMARLSFQGSSDNQIELSRLEYTRPLNGRTTLFVSLLGGSLNDFADTLNPNLSGSARGSISRFGQRNPIYRHGEGTGVGISYQFTPQLKLQAGYLAADAPNPEAGLTGGAYGMISQLTVRPAEFISFGLTYGRSYNSLDTNTGSERANDPFADQSNAILTDTWGLQVSLRPHARVNLGGWLGYSRARGLDLANQPTAEVFNWAATLAFPDLGGEGSLLGVVMGQPPKLISNQFHQAGAAYVDSSTSLHLEAFYRRRITNNLDITWGVIALTQPDHNANTAPVVVGTMRTTFNF